MKKDKQESPAKAAKKIMTKSIRQRLIKNLKTITAELGQVEIDIEKEAKKLAKKITKHLKTVKEPEKVATPTPEANKVEKKPEVNNAKSAAKTAPVATRMPVTKPAAQTATAAAAKKPVAKPAPVKASAPKKEVAKVPAAKNAKK
jgi:hypothetical protein